MGRVELLSQGPDARNYINSLWRRVERFQHLALLLFLFLPLPGLVKAQFSQQGPKLVGTNAVGSAYQGCSVCLSSDGSTAIVGGNGDSSFAGAVWVWIRSGGVWTQQGSKLVGSGAVGISQQGFSVSLSSDGNTALVGGPIDSGNAGASWVWARSGGVWAQQGNKLVGNGAGGSTPQQGWSVSLSSDGNTAIVGGPSDNSSEGAAWVFIRSGGVWTQQGGKLVGTGAVGSLVNQGESVSLSSDGNTAIVGGPSDDGNAGAAWVFTRSGGVWTQQGGKLVGGGASGDARQGSSISLSSDGNTAIIGGPHDSSSAGAAWVWTRSGGVWTQQGSKLVGADAVGNASQGTAVSLSSSGNTALIGGPNDSSSAGAAWVWTRSASVWTQQGSKIVGTGTSVVAWQGISVSLSADSTTAIVGGYQDSSAAGAAWIFTTLNSPLPVELTSFSIASDQFSAILHWNTITEVDNSGFEIERGAISGHQSVLSNQQSRPKDGGQTTSDNSRFIQVGFVPGSGTSTSPKQYSFVDRNLSAGTYAYRLMQVDRNGAYKYSPEVDVVVGIAPKEFSLSQNYPNPFNPTTSIEFTVPSDGRVTLKVYDMLGREVATLVDRDVSAGVYQQVVFDATKLGSGVYYARLEFGGKQLLKKMTLLK